MIKNTLLFTLLFSVSIIGACTAQKSKNEVYAVSLQPKGNQDIAAFAAGCFWCTEHVFDEVLGVDSVVVVGYAGGRTVNPTYEQVCTETTGHAESIMVYYNPKKLSYQQLLDVFFLSQDPTTPNQQGPDRGSSYRSVIFYQTKEQSIAAYTAIEKYNKSGLFKNPIITQVSPLKAFYRAEQYHQKYVKNNPYNPYVRGVSAPRFDRFKKLYPQALKQK